MFRRQEGELNVNGTGRRCHVHFTQAFTFTTSRPRTFPASSSGCGREYLETT